MTNSHQIPFYRLTPNDVLKIMEKTPYESYFRLLSTSKAFKELIHRCDRFKFVLPVSVKLIIEDTGEEQPTLIWEDHDWNTNSDSAVRYRTTIDDSFCDFLQCARFDRICIQPSENNSLFKNCERLEKFFAATRIRCNTLSLLEIESKETCWKLYQMIKPKRLMIRCARTDTHELLTERKFDLAYLQLYIPLSAAMPVMGDIIGTIPSVRVTYVSRNLDSVTFLSHLLNVFKMAIKVPPKSCWHLRLSYTVLSRGFLQISSPSKDDVANIFRGFNFEYTRTGEDDNNTNFEAISRLDRGEYMAETKITKSLIPTGNLFHNCTFTFEIQHHLNFEDAKMVIRTNNDI